ncbi:hypothetical protein [Agromyces sp. NPDC056965]|uniref:hypothetical protein n=1 Tax=Agromyces sp. NPDC056965 TaxID=3345983 RepID=UPI00362FB661
MSTSIVSDRKATRASASTETPTSPHAWAEGAQRLLQQYGVDLPTPDLAPFAEEWADTLTYFVPWSVKLGVSMEIGAALDLCGDLRDLAAGQGTGRVLRRNIDQTAQLADLEN